MRPAQGDAKGWTLSAEKAKSDAALLPGQWVVLLTQAQENGKRGFHFHTEGGHKRHAHFPASPTLQGCWEIKMEKESWTPPELPKRGREGENHDDTAKENKNVDQLAWLSNLLPSLVWVSGEKLPLADEHNLFIFPVFLKLRTGNGIPGGGGGMRALPYLSTKNLTISIPKA